jgi:hypothetical protein
MSLMVELVLEDLNGGIDIVNVGIESLDFLLVLYVVKNQHIDFLFVDIGQLDRGKNGQVGLH